MRQLVSLRRPNNLIKSVEKAKFGCFFNALIVPFVQNGPKFGVEPRDLSRGMTPYFAKGYNFLLIHRTQCRDTSGTSMCTERENSNSIRIADGQTIDKMT